MKVQIVGLIQLIQAFGRNAPKLEFIMDMVYNNPGEKSCETKYHDPNYLLTIGFNAMVIERLVWYVKYVNVYLNVYENGQSLWKGLEPYFQFYNHERLLQSQNYHNHKICMY